VDEGTGWIGNFDYGENLVWTGNPNFGLGGGGFAIVLANPVSSIGIGIQTNLYGIFASTITLFDTGGTQIFSGIYNGDSTGSEGGDHLFIGLGDITGPNIGAIGIRP